MCLVGVSKPLLPDFQVRMRSAERITVSGHTSGATQPKIVVWQSLWTQEVQGLS